MNKTPVNSIKHYNWMMTSYVKGTGSAVRYLLQCSKSQEPLYQLTQLINVEQINSSTASNSKQSQQQYTSHQLARKSWMLMSAKTSALLWLELISKVQLEKVQTWNYCSAACWLPGSGTGHEKGGCGNTGVLSADGFGRASCPWKSVLVSSARHTLTSCKALVLS